MNRPLVYGLWLWPPIMVGGSISDSQRALHCHLTQAAGFWVSTLGVTISQVRAGFFLCTNQLSFACILDGKQSKGIECEFFQYPCV